MASMGLLGAVGGLGEGMLKRAESMEKEKLMDAEEAKAKRLAQFGAGLKETAATTTYERGVAETKRGEGIASGAAVTKAGALKLHQEAERQSRLDVQKLKNVGSREAGGTPKYMDRWRFTPGNEFDPSVAFDKIRNKAYVLSGDKYVLKGTDPDEIPIFSETVSEEESTKHRRDIAVLQSVINAGTDTVKNREGKDIEVLDLINGFENKYLYLPIWAVEGLSAYKQYK